MIEEPSQETIDQWHRWFASRCNNQAWDLIAKPQRTSKENRNMLYLAYASAYHWSRVGALLNDARAEITLANVHALLGDADLALFYAQRCLDYFENHNCEDWDRAFAHAAMAHAAAAKKDKSLHAKHYAKAQELGEAIHDQVDRRIFLDELARIPSKIA